MHIKVATLTATLLCSTSPLLAACPAGVDPRASISLAPPTANPNISEPTPYHTPGSCHFHYAENGAPLPDPNCTPGAINPTVTPEVLRDRSFSTKCLRNQATSEDLKRITYSWYGITEPPDNYGIYQTCELDHLCDLADGCADTLDNIYPQCGRSPNGVPWFRIKDHVEVQTSDQIKAGTLDQPTTQRQMALDWTQLLP